MIIKNKLLKLVLVINVVLMLVSCGSSETAQKTRSGAETGATLGALAGVVFGGGDLLGDAAGGAIRGAALGAGIGYVTGKMDEKNVPEEYKPTEEEMLIAAFGNDNVESYYALRSREHKRAWALAEAGELSSDANHRLAAMWMKALIAVDEKASDKADKEFDRLIIFDPDIDTRDQAKMETDKLVLEMRSERRQLGI